MNIPKTVALRILKEDLGKRKFYARFVPHCLTPEQREDRVTSCQDIIAMADADNFFLTILLWEKRPDVLSLTPKQSDRVLNRLVRHPLGRRNKLKRSRTQAMLIIFFATHGVAHKGFVPEGKTVNAEFYKGVMDRLLKRIQRVRTAAFCSLYILLLLDNVPSYKATSVCQFLTPRNVTTLHHTPYSTDLSPPDYFLFLKLKTKLKGLTLRCC